jgi:hypothetical protein
MQPEATELSRVDVLNEWLIEGGSDTSVQDSGRRSGVGGRVELAARNISGRGNVDQVCRSEDGFPHQ